MTHTPAPTKQEELARQARTLHAAWMREVGPGSVTAAAYVLQQVEARVMELREELARGSISPEEHNDQRFVLVMGMRRLVDAGGEARGLRTIARAIHDVYADTPLLPHPKYRFTFDWVTQHTPAWERDLAHLTGRPDVRGLEIGCFEGRSACWFLDHVLTGPGSRLTCVDPFAIPMDSVVLRGFERHFDHNVAASGAAGRVTKLIGSSQVVLRSLPPGQFDFVYVDGSHRVGDVLQDAVRAWTLLAAGGVVIFDDYGLVDDEAAGGLSARAPGRALDAFVGLLGAEGEILRRDWQLVLRRA